MNHLENFKKLNNEYFAFRHGQSKANVAEIVVTSLENGVKEEYTLTAEGETQVKDSTNKAKAEGVLDENTIIYASPFSRTKKTAEIVKKILGAKSEIIFDERLCERFFGDWEGSDYSANDKVWSADDQNPHHKENNIESTIEVLKRTTELIKDLEEKYKGKKILLVSHGDPLRILQTGFQKAPSNSHRKLSLHNAEIRKMELK